MVADASEAKAISIVVEFTSVTLLINPPINEFTHGFVQWWPRVALLQ